MILVSLMVTNSTRNCINSPVKPASIDDHSDHDDKDFVLIAELVPFVNI